MSGTQNDSFPLARLRALGSDCCCQGVFLRHQKPLGLNEGWMWPQTGLTPGQGRNLCVSSPCCAAPSLGVCLHSNPMLVSLFKCFFFFYPSDKKIERLDTDDLDEIEKIAN